VFAIAVDRLRDELDRRGKSIHFLLFQSYDLDDAKLSYKDLAERHGIPATDVTNYLALARREFRRILLDLLREMTASDREFRAEARALLEIESPS
jgi:hypothetical protein